VKTALLRITHDIQTEAKKKLYQPKSKHKYTPAVALKGAIRDSSTANPHH